jgi:hypothetical protein
MSKTKPPNNFWQFIYATGSYFITHGTRMLGIAQGTVAVIAGMNGIIPPEQLKYYLGLSAVLTYWRGQANADKIAKMTSTARKTAKKNVIKLRRKR